MTSCSHHHQISPVISPLMKMFSQGIFATLHSVGLKGWLMNTWRDDVFSVLNEKSLIKWRNQTSKLELWFEALAKPGTMTNSAVKVNRVSTIWTWEPIIARHPKNTTRHPLVLLYVQYIPIHLHFKSQVSTPSWHFLSFSTRGDAGRSTRRSIGNHQMWRCWLAGSHGYRSRYHDIFKNWKISKHQSQKFGEEIHFYHLV